MSDLNNIEKFFYQVNKTIGLIDKKKINNLIKEIVKIKSKKGRIFFLGVGGSAGNASHAVNDFRKICNIECYTPVDNVSELTARTNDEGWETVFSEWINISNANKNDSILIFSVGGGNFKKKVSVNIINLIKSANKIGMKVFGIVGKKDGYTAKNSDLVICIPEVNKNRVTPISESFQAIVWHCLVSHPDLQIYDTKW